MLHNRPAGSRGVEAPQLLWAAWLGPAAAGTCRVAGAGGHVQQAAVRAEVGSSVGVEEAGGQSVHFGHPADILESMLSRGAAAVRHTKP